MSGLHVRCRPWSTIVAPAAKSRSSLSSLTWSRDRGPDATALGELTVAEGLPVAGDPEEGGPQAPTRDELVDRALAEELEQPARAGRRLG